ncbi:MAG TPA: hypothetical protein VM347_25350, partial [Nonomuraea sp.]|nr:hypothetical protein [Nonomuraea sp.]
DLTIEPKLGEPGWYEGRLTATAGTDRLTTPIAFRKQAKMDTVRVKLVGKPEWAKLNPGPLSVIRVSDTDPLLAGEPLSMITENWRTTDVPGTVETVIKLAHGGVYSTSASPWWFTSRAHQQLQYGLLLAPETKLDGDTTIVLDATKTERLQVSTPRESEPVFLNTMNTRTTPGGRMYAGAALLSYEPVIAGDYWVTPVKSKPTVGTATFLFDEIRRAPEVSLSVPGLRLHPRYISEHDALVPKFAADQRLSLATSGADVRGKLVYLPARNSLQLLLADLDLAIKGGAAGVITSDRFAWLLSADAYKAQNKLPVLWIDSAEGDTLGKAMAREPYPAGKLTVQPTSPFEYKLAYYVTGTTAGRLTFAPKARDLTEIDTTYHAEFPPQQGTWGPYPDFNEVDHTFIPLQPLSIRGSHLFGAPLTRTEYYSTTGSEVLWQRGYEFRDPNTDTGHLAMSERAFTRATQEREDWNETLMPTQITTGPDRPDWANPLIYCDGCRQGDRLRLRALTPVGLGYYTDASDPSHTYTGAPGDEQTHLFSGATEVQPQYDDFGVPYYSVPAGSGTYRLTDVWKDAFAGKHPGTSVESTWTFRSARPVKNNTPYPCIDSTLWDDKQPCARLPLIQLRYQLNLPGDDTVPAGRLFTFTVKAEGGASALRVWTSADKGAHWARATVLPGLGGSYKVLTLNPAGSITIKAEAKDKDGNTVTQTVADAYLVK